MKNIKLKTNEIKAYEFKDLSEEVQEKVIMDHANFWLEVRQYDEKNKGNFEKAIDKAEEMKTPWFTHEYIYKYCKDEIIEEIKANKYLFDKKGNILPVTYHVENNEIVKTTMNIENNELEVELV